MIYLKLTASLAFTYSLLILLALSGVRGNSNYGNYYTSQYPVLFNGQYPGYFRNQLENYSRPAGSQVSSIQGQPPNNFVYWPPAALNAIGQRGSPMIPPNQENPFNMNANDNNRMQTINDNSDLISSLSNALIQAFTSVLFPQQQETFHYGPTYLNGLSSSFASLVPSAGIQLGPSKQYGYGSNLGVYAGIQNSGNGYNYNYNTNSMPVNPYNRPYGPNNSNVGGSYGGLSSWPFIQPMPQSGKLTTKAATVTSSKITRPTQTTSESESQTTIATGTVQILSVTDLIEEETKKSTKSTTH